MRGKALPGLVGLTFLAIGRLGAPVPARAQGCAADEFSVPSLGTTTHLTETATHYYEGRVPVQYQPPHTSLYLRLLQAITNNLYLRDPQDPGNPALIHNPGGVSGLLRGLTLERLPSGYAEAFGSQEDGYVVRWDGLDMAEIDRIYIGRGSIAGTFCEDPAGGIALQIAEHSTAAFQAAHGGNDLLYAASAYRSNSPCGGSNTDNKIYALNAGDFSNIVWTFNEFGSLDVDTVSGLAVDRVLVDAGGGLERDAFQDRLFVTTERTDHPTQDSVWSINVLTGGLEWAVSAGRIQTSPVVRGDRLYVATINGELKALDKSDGSELWSIQRFIPFVRNFAVSLKAPYDDLIVLVDYFGDVVLARDNGSSAEWLWIKSLDQTGTVKATTAPVIDDLYGDVYVGANDGKVYQLDIATGAVNGIRTIASAGGDVVELLRESPTSGAIPFAYSLVAADEGTVIARYCTPFTVPGVPSSRVGGLVALCAALMVSAAWVLRRSHRARAAGGK